MTAIAIWDEGGTDNCDTDIIKAYIDDSQLLTPNSQWSEHSGETLASFFEIVPIEPHRDFNETLEAIRDSRKLLDLGNDWDDEGGVGYFEDTWKRATDFLRMQATAARSRLHVRLRTPLIAPASNGSIDLYWRGSNGSLLLNFPAEADAFATFYGESARGETTAGLLASDHPRLDLVEWASQLH